MRPHVQDLKKFCLALGGAANPLVTSAADRVTRAKEILENYPSVKPMSLLWWSLSAIETALGLV
jgi:hypothetical protein